MAVTERYDVIVIGSGHAGIEACLASARMGANTVLITANLETIGRMSCNPAIGGLAKGHIVRELSALGGEMAKSADATGIQFRKLNTKKGPAVQGTRCQSDKHLYEKLMQAKLRSAPNLKLANGLVEELLTAGTGENLRITGVITSNGDEFLAEAVVLTTGTFLRGILHIGLQKFEGGRIGEEPVRSLSSNLKKLGFTLGRLKTGTPARLDGRTLDYSKMVAQEGDTPQPRFSFDYVENNLPQKKCYITHTTAKTHEVISKNLDRSPLFTGAIEGVGPRYCPSIEDKIVRFSDKPSHHVFIEPEGIDTYSMYPNGISTSLPVDVQIEVVHSLPGCGNAKFLKPGYAVEYDFCDPRSLYHSLETKQISGLFMAGQINGTSGYEEAAGQGFVAGVNAVLKIRGKEPFVLRRNESYIGVLIDDLVRIGTSEPYRMFTSRAEYRLIMREDNADLRLMEKGFKLGLISRERFELLEKKRANINRAVETARNTFLTPTEETNETLRKMGTAPIATAVSLFALMRRKELEVSSWKKYFPILNELNAEEIEQFEIITRYDGYLKRQEEEARRMTELENVKIPVALDFKNVSGLSNEIVEKLQRTKPLTLGEASRISGITPASISILWIYLKTRFYSNPA